MDRSGTFSARIALRLLMVAALAIALGACGRRGAPERPASASLQAIDEAGNVIEEPARPADRPFILDPLLQ